MLLLFSIYVFCLGLIVGSFLNVVALRYNTGRSVGGRSHCFSCRKVLHWYELIPLVSFMIQGGRCRKCKSKLSWQYPLGELVTALLFLGSFLHSVSIYGVMSLDSLTLSTLYLAIFTAILCFISSLLMVILIYDVRHKIIPDKLSFLFALASVGVILFQNDLSWWRVLAGPIVALPFYLIWRFSDGRLMGLGDAKLMASIGWLLGLSGAVSAIVLAFWIAAAIAIPLLFLQKVLPKMSLRYARNKLTIKSEIPFAPFLILGMYLVLFFGLNVFPYVFTF
ncbi:MAG: prepilin peptidase [Candidatus Pacebacteria bacterium]|nr:prepilin peptidase [Candidatus Paceibacterota bacterium]